MKPVASGEKKFGELQARELFTFSDSYGAVHGVVVRAPKLYKPRTPGAFWREDSYSAVFLENHARLGWVAWSPLQAYSTPVTVTGVMDSRELKVKAHRAGVGTEEEVAESTFGELRSGDHFSYRDPLTTLVEKGMVVRDLEVVPEHRFAFWRRPQATATCISMGSYGTSEWHPVLPLATPVTVENAHRELTV